MICKRISKARRQLQSISQRLITRLGFRSLIFICIADHNLCCTMARNFMTIMDKKLKFARIKRPNSSSAFSTPATYSHTHPSFTRSMRRYVPLCTFVGGPSPLFFTERTINSRGHWYAIDASGVLGPYALLRHRENTGLRGTRLR